MALNTLNKCCRPLVILIFFFGGTQPKLFAQSFDNYTLIDFGLTEGLPSTSVYSICEDNAGRIWIGTENGLAYLENGRFNALSIHGIPRLVLGVYPANDGGIFVIGNKPSVIVKVNDLNTVSTLHTRDNGVFTGVLVQFSSLQQAVYFSDWGSVMKCTETAYDTVAKIAGTNLKSMSISREGDIVLGKESGICQVSKGIAKRKFGQRVSRAAFSNNGDIVGFYKDSIHIYSSDFSTVSSVSVSNKEDGYIVNAIVSKNGDYWYCGSQSGLYRYNGREEQSVDKVLGLEQYSFASLFEDQQGNVWCGTNGDGLLLLRKSSLRNIGAGDGLIENSIRAISNMPNNSKLILTRNHGQLIDHDYTLSRMDLKIWGKKAPAIQIKYALPLPTGLLLGGSFPYRVRCVTGRLNDTIPVTTTFSSCATLVDDQISIGSWGIFKRHHINALDTTVVGLSLLYGERFGRTDDIVPIDSGAVVATETAMYYWNYADSTHTKMPGIPPSESGISLATTADDSLWCLTVNSLYRWDGKKWRRARRRLLGSSFQFKDMIVDHEDHFWLGTESGLVLLDGFKRSLYTTHNGLANNSINTMLLDTLEGHLWMGTEGGLSIAAIDDLLETKVFNGKIVFDSLYTPNGLKILSPENSALPRTEKTVSINFSIENYFEALPVLYKYRIRDEDDGNWQESKHGTATFPALNSGNYAFDVAVQISGSQWSKVQTLNFSIERAIWTYWQFYLALSVSIVLLTLGIYKMRVASVRKRELEKRKVAAKINELEIRALNANMNPHFIFNSLNSIQHYLVPLKNRQAFDFISNLSRLIRLNMAALGHKEVSLAGELKRTELYVELEKERLNNRLTFEVELDLHKSSEEIFIPSMIIQPLVENSIWHGIAPLNTMGLIKLTINYESPFLKIEVNDNGVGLVESAANRNKNHDSVATNLTRDRLNHHHSDNKFHLDEIRDSKGNVLGTKASIELHLSE